MKKAPTHISLILDTDASLHRATTPGEGEGGGRGGGERGRERGRRERGEREEGEERERGMGERGGRDMFVIDAELHIYTLYLPWNFPRVCSVFPNFRDAEQ